MIKAEESNGNKLKLWVIYDKPIDFPNKIVARLFLNDTPTDQIIISDNIENLRDEFMSSGLYKIDRHPKDDSNIIETWI